MKTRNTACSVLAIVTSAISFNAAAMLIGPKTPKGTDPIPSACKRLFEHMHPDAFEKVKTTMVQTIVDEPQSPTENLDEALIFLLEAEEFNQPVRNAPQFVRNILARDTLSASTMKLAAQVVASGVLHNPAYGETEIENLVNTIISKRFLAEDALKATANAVGNYFKNNQNTKDLTRLAAVLLDPVKKEAVNSDVLLSIVSALSRSGESSQEESRLQLLDKISNHPKADDKVQKEIGSVLMLTFDASTPGLDRLIPQLRKRAPKAFDLDSPKMTEVSQDILRLFIDDLQTSPSTLTLIAKHTKDQKALELLLTRSDLPTEGLQFVTLKLADYFPSTESQWERRLKIFGVITNHHSVNDTVLLAVTSATLRSASKVKVTPELKQLYADINKKSPGAFNSIDKHPGVSSDLLKLLVSDENINVRALSKIASSTQDASVLDLLLARERLSKDTCVALALNLANQAVNLKIGADPLLKMLNMLASKPTADSHVLTLIASTILRSVDPATEGLAELIAKINERDPLAFNIPGALASASANQMKLILSNGKTDAAVLTQIASSSMDFEVLNLLLTQEGLSVEGLQAVTQKLSRLAIETGTPTPAQFDALTRVLRHPLNNAATFNSVHSAILKCGLRADAKDKTFALLLFANVISKWSSLNSLRDVYEKLFRVRITKDVTPFLGSMEALAKIVSNSKTDLQLVREIEGFVGVGGSVDLNAPSLDKVCKELEKRDPNYMYRDFQSHGVDIELLPSKD